MTGLCYLWLPEECVVWVVEEQYRPTIYDKGPGHVLSGNFRQSFWVTCVVEEIRKLCLYYPDMFCVPEGTMMVVVSSLRTPPIGGGLPEIGTIDLPHPGTGVGKSPVPSKQVDLSLDGVVAGVPPWLVALVPAKSASPQASKKRKSPEETAAVYSTPGRPMATSASTRTSKKRKSPVVAAAPSTARPKKRKTSQEADIGEGAQGGKQGGGTATSQEGVNHEGGEGGEGAQGGEQGGGTAASQEEGSHEGAEDGEQGDTEGEGGEAAGEEGGEEGDAEGEGDEEGDAER